MYFLDIIEMFIVIFILSFVIHLLNKKGITIGSYQQNIPLKIFLALVLLGVFMRISFLFEYESFLKETVEPILGIVIIYIIMALLNRNDFLDKLKIHDFVGALLIVGGIVILIIIFSL